MFWGFFYKCDFNSKMCILNIYPEDFTSNNLRFLHNICFLEAKCCITSWWKKETLWGISQWIKQITFYFALEKIRYLLGTNLSNLGKSGLFFTRGRTKTIPNSTSGKRICDETNCQSLGWFVFFCFVLSEVIFYVFVNEWTCSCALVKISKDMFKKAFDFTVMFVVWTSVNS